MPFSRHTRRSVFSIGAASLAAAFLFLTPENTHAADTTAKIHILTLDSGSNAIVLESVDDNGQKIFGMVDSGEDWDYPDGSDPRYPLRSGITTSTGYDDEVLSYLDSLGVTSDNLQFYVATHPHSDHIGTGDTIVRLYSPDRVYLLPYDDSYIYNTARLWDNLYVYDQLLTAVEETEGVTLIQHLNGLLQPTAGEILLRGKNIWAEPKKIREVRFKVGLVFQYPEYQLFEETVYKDIAFGPANQGKTGDELDHAVREAAKLVGIRDDQLEKSPFELSGGQKRRVALAGVLAMEPEVLVLDEPTAGLDPAGRENLMANIRDYHRNKGKTIILVSHSMDEIARNVDRILVLKNAHVLMQGTPAEVFARGEELLSAGLDVPQITRIAMELKRRGVDIDPAVYTVEALERQLLALRKGGAGC